MPPARGDGCFFLAIGYYECEKGVEYAAKVQSESPVVRKWDAYMKDILIMEPVPVTKAQPKLEKVFELQ